MTGETQLFGLPEGYEKWGLAGLREIVVSAGRIMEEWCGRPVGHHEKADHSPVTIVDEKVNDYLKKNLSKLVPGSGWLSEESEDDLRRLDCDWVWVVDPLDGTKEFIRGIPEVAISVGLVFRGQVVSSAVYNPLTAEGGVSVGQRQVQFWGCACVERSTPGLLADATVSVSRTEVEKDEINNHLRLFGQHKVIGSVAYKLLRVAANREDLTVSVQPKSEWDICGGVGLLQAVGKRYQRLDQKVCSFNQKSPRVPCGAVAGAPHLVQQVMDNAQIVSSGTKDLIRSK